MILISNNAQKYLDKLNEAVIRVNMAWYQSKKELWDVLDELRREGKTAFLDFPSGRTKPPTPILTFDHAFEIMIRFANVKYFAISNTEDIEYVAEIRKIIPEAITLVPKIETPVGILSLLDICNAGNTNVVMLDKEDLYNAVGKENKFYNKCLEFIRKTAKENNITVLELQGVLFVG